ncbi:MAG TPA: methyltransferase domain-containing protein [Verrucomicrobiae bacterium]|nr:methyltransferase domain-containing protein [Verrucomicrobiae bacterium]
MYIPSDDTFFIADMIRDYKGDYALEIGIGSGYLTNILCKNFKFVIGTDIDFTSTKHSKDQLKQFNNKFLLCCNICEPINLSFDIIVSNPPYLPFDNKYSYDKKIYGGIKGVEITLNILKLFKFNLKDFGKIIFIVSSLSDNAQLEEYIILNNLNKKILAKKKLFYETLEIWEITI